MSYADGNATMTSNTHGNAHAHSTMEQRQGQDGRQDFRRQSYSGRGRRNGSGPPGMDVEPQNQANGIRKGQQQKPENSSGQRKQQGARPPSLDASTPTIEFHVAAVEKELHQKQGELEQYKKILQERSELTAVKNELEEAKKQSDSFQAQHATIVNELQSRLMLNESDAEKQKAQLANAQEESQQLRTGLLERDSIILKLTEDNKTRGHQVNELERKLKDAYVTASQAQDKADRQEALLSSLKDNVAANDDKILRLNSVIQALEQEKLAEHQIKTELTAKLAVAQQAAEHSQSERNNVEIHYKGECEKLCKEVDRLEEELHNKAHAQPQTYARQPGGVALYPIEQPTIHFGAGPHTPPILDQTQQGRRAMTSQERTVGPLSPESSLLSRLQKPDKNTMKEESGLVQHADAGREIAERARMQQAEAPRIQSGHGNPATLVPVAVAARSAAAPPYAIVVTPMNEHFAQAHSTGLSDSGKLADGSRAPRQRGWSTSLTALPATKPASQPCQTASHNESWANADPTPERSPRGSNADANPATRRQKNAAESRGNEKRAKPAENRAPSTNLPAANSGATGEMAPPPGFTPDASGKRKQTIPVQTDNNRDDFGGRFGHREESQQQPRKSHQGRNSSDQNSRPSKDKSKSTEVPPQANDFVQKSSAEPKVGYAAKVKQGAKMENSGPNVRSAQPEIKAETASTAGTRNSRPKNQQRRRQKALEEGNAAKQHGS